VDKNSTIDGADEKAETSKGNTRLDVVRRENRWATVETMGALRPESFVNPPLERKLRMLTEHELKEQASNVRPILADGDCIDLEVFEGVLEMDEDEGLGAYAEDFSGKKRQLSGNRSACCEYLQLYLD